MNAIIVLSTTFVRNPFFFFFFECVRELSKQRDEYFTNCSNVSSAILHFLYVLIYMVWFIHNIIIGYIYEEVLKVLDLQ